MLQHGFCKKNDGIRVWKWTKFNKTKANTYQFSSRCGNLKSRIVSRTCNFRPQSNKHDAKNKIKSKYLYKFKHWLWALLEASDRRAWYKDQGYLKSKLIFIINLSINLIKRNSSKKLLYWLWLLTPPINRTQGLDEMRSKDDQFETLNWTNSMEFNP